MVQQGRVSCNFKNGQYCKEGSGIKYKKGLYILGAGVNGLIIYMSSTESSGKLCLIPC